MSLIDKIKFLGLAAFHYARGDFTITRMPVKRKRKQRRGVIKRKRRKRMGFKGRRPGKRRGQYRRQRSLVLPRSLGLFPYKATIMLDFHDLQNLSAGAAGIMTTLHYRMNSIFDPLVNVGGTGTRVSYYAEVANIYSQYVVKSVFVKIKARLNSNNVAGKIPRVWLYNDKTNQAAPNNAQIESWMDRRDNNNRPMKWRHFTNTDRTLTMKQRFFAWETTKEAELIRDHATDIDESPTTNHFFAIGVDQAERNSTPGINYDIFLRYETIVFDPKTVAEVAAPE